MKKILIFGVMAAAVTACHENLEERAVREAREFTAKSCPMAIAENIVIDSMTFERASKTVRYHYRLEGALDTVIQEDVKKKTEKDMLEGVRNTPSLKNYKEAGYNFRYTFRSSRHKEKILLEYLFTEKDYD